LARFSLGARATGAATSVLPAGSLYAGSTGGGTLREVGVTNTTTTALVVALARFTTAGTSSSVAQVPAKHNVNSGPSLCTVRNVHSSTPPTLDADLGYRITLGAAAGAAIIWTFGDDGIQIPIGTGQGIGIYTPTGTGQVCDFYFVWDE
jgi:hypothetical protein